MKSISKIAPTLAATMLLASCLPGLPPMQDPPTIALSTPFDAGALAWAQQPGSNRITGDAVMRTRGGEVKTCAGLTTYLLPASPYTEEYVTRRFGSKDGGYSSDDSILQGIYDLDPGLKPFRVYKTCNAQGQFTFDNLPDGAYYVVATVTWEAPSGYGEYMYMATQGGDIAKRIEVAGGKTVSVTLTA